MYSWSSWSTGILCFIQSSQKLEYAIPQWKSINILHLQELSSWNFFQIVFYDQLEIRFCFYNSKGHNWKMSHRKWIVVFSIGLVKNGLSVDQPMNVLYQFQRRIFPAKMLLSYVFIEFIWSRSVFLIEIHWSSKVLSWTQRYSKY